MKAFITITSFGFIVTSENFNIVDTSLFGDDAANKLNEIHDNKLLKDEISLIERISSNYDYVVIETSRSSSLFNHYNFDCEVTTNELTEHGDYIRNNFDNILCEVFEGDITDYLSTTYTDVARMNVQSSVKSDDVMIVESVNSLEELEDTTGKMIERLRQWCTPYLPELDKLGNHMLYARIISEWTNREDVNNSELLSDINISLDDTYSVEIDEDDLEIIKSFAFSVYKLYESKNSLEEFLDSKVKMVAPNLYSVAGANLASKLIAHVGGLENLAKLPSSTIQVIGAEKAMFRHLKTGDNPPKHGLIFQHPLVRGSNWWVRGRLARAVASKITIAARKDAFGGSYDDSLRQELEEYVDEIKKNHPFPERKNKNKKEETGKKGKKSKKKGKKKKRNKRKLRKGEYSY